MPAPAATRSFRWMRLYPSSTPITICATAFQQSACLRFPPTPVRKSISSISLGLGVTSCTAEAENSIPGGVPDPRFRPWPGVFRAHLVAELRSQVQHSIPFVQVVLMLLGLNQHFRRAIPQVKLLVFVPQADLPLVASRPQRQPGKFMPQRVHSSLEIEVRNRPAPHQLPSSVVERNPVFAVAYGLAHVHGKRSAKSPGRS